MDRPSVYPSISEKSVFNLPHFDESEEFQNERTRLFGWIFWIAGISFIFHSFGLRKEGHRVHL